MNSLWENTSLAPRTTRNVPTTTDSEKANLIFRVARRTNVFVVENTTGDYWYWNGNREYPRTACHWKLSSSAYVTVMWWLNWRRKTLTSQQPHTATKHELTQHNRREPVDCSRGRVGLPRRACRPRSKYTHFAWKPSNREEARCGPAIQKQMNAKNQCEISEANRRDHIVFCYRVVPESEKGCVGLLA